MAACRCVSRCRKNSMNSLSRSTDVPFGSQGEGVQGWSRLKESGRKSSCVQWLDGEVPNLYASKNICPNREFSPFVGSPSLLRAKLARRKAVMGIDSTVYIAIDRAKTLREEPTKGHNRWHPDIPPVATIEPGQVIGLETRDALDGQVTPSSTAADLRRINLNVVHPLTGP